VTTTPSQTPSADPPDDGADDGDLGVDARQPRVFRSAATTADQLHVLSGIDTVRAAAAVDVAGAVGGFGCTSGAR